MAKKKRFKIQFTVRAVPMTDKIFFIQNLGLMIKTGFSMADALNTLQSQTKHKLFKQTIAQLYQDVLAGETFASALSKHPAIFDDLFVNMIAAGETSGNLEITLHQLANQLKKSYALRRKIRSAMIYPSLIVSVMIIVGVSVFIFVIPKILDLYTANNYVLPLPTKLILWLSNFVQNNALTLAVGLIVVGLIAFLLWRSKPGRYIIDRIILRLPIAGRIVKQIMIATIMRLLNSLIVTDIPIVKSFQMIAPTLNNARFREFMYQSTDQLSKGGNIHSAMLARLDLFDPVVAQMVRVGENTGALDMITAEIAEFFEQEVDTTMSNLAVIIEPVLMIVIGIGVAFLAVAIIMPIYALVQQV